MATRLWQVIEEDGVDWLLLVHHRWGQLLGSCEVASHWADEFLSQLTTVWSDLRPGDYVRGTSMCLSSFLAVGHHTDLLDVLAFKRFHSAPTARSEYKRCWRRPESERLWHKSSSILSWPPQPFTSVGRVGQLTTASLKLSDCSTTS